MVEIVVIVGAAATAVAALATLAITLLEFFYRLPRRFRKVRDEVDARIGKELEKVEGRVGEAEAHIGEELKKVRGKVGQAEEHIGEELMKVQDHVETKIGGVNGTVGKLIEILQEFHSGAKNRLEELHQEMGGGKRSSDE